MFVVGNLVATLAQMLNSLFEIYWWILVIRCLISWVSPDPFNPIVHFLVRVTDPVLEPLRRVIPPLGMFDLSAVAALLLLRALQSFLVRTLLDLSVRLR